MPPISFLSAMSLVLFQSFALLAALQAQEANVELIGKSIVDEKTLTFAIGPAAKFSTTINGRSHQQTPLTTCRGFQYATYFDAQRRLCVARRKLPSGSWEVIQFKDHKFETNDAHNTSVIGICNKDGTIHLAFDHHATQLNYRVSKIGAAHEPESVQWNVDLFGPVTHTLGSVVPDPRVTYPRFVSAPNGKLMLFYRGVTSGDGNGMIEEYDGEKHDWTPGLGKVIARDIGTFIADGKTSEYRCPYMNSVSFAGGRLHASWVWRERFERTNSRNQHDLCYAYSDDVGRTWLNSDGEMIGKTGTRFINLHSPGLVVASIPINSKLTNQNTHYAYADGSIHVVVRQWSESASESRYYHYWRNSNGKWNQEVLPFSGSRPKLVGTKDRTLILAYTDEDDDEKEELFVAKGQPDLDQKSWQWTNVKLPHRHSIVGEALLDLERWEKEAVLSIYGQEEPKKVIRTQLPGPVDGFPAALTVVDYRLNKDTSDEIARLIKPPAGRLAIVVDGNSPDPDDIGATAVILGLLRASGLRDRLVHLSHSCDLKPVARISAKDEIRRQNVLHQVCLDGISHFGPFKNLSNFYNCRTQQAAAVKNLCDAINNSSQDNPLWIIEAGEPDVIGYALKAADRSKIQHVLVVSHHPANDNSGDFFKWQQILDFGVKEHQIGDQNAGLQTEISSWDWAKEHPDSRINWIWKQLKYAEQDGVVKFQTNKFDCSDAGMVYWWITGADRGGNKFATPTEVEQMLQRVP
jgi:hypothetical protein